MFDINMHSEAEIILLSWEYLEHVSHEILHLFFLGTRELLLEKLATKDILNYSLFQFQRNAAGILEFREIILPHCIHDHLEL